MCVFSGGNAPSTLPTERSTADRPPLDICTGRRRYDMSCQVRHVHRQRGYMNHKGAIQRVSMVVLLPYARPSFVNLQRFRNRRMSLGMVFKLVLIDQNKVVLATGLAVRESRGRRGIDDTPRRFVLFRLRFLTPFFQRWSPSHLPLLALCRKSQSVSYRENGTLCSADEVMRCRPIQVRRRARRSQLFHSHGDQVWPTFGHGIYNSLRHETK